MKRMVAANVFVLLFVFSFMVTDAMAIGFGFNLSAGGGSTEWDIEDRWFNTETTEDSDDARGGIGFIFDTAVAKNTLFHYRLNVGAESVDYEMDSGGTYETSGWFMAHDFGFAFVRKKNLRLWAGPEIRFSYSEGELDTNSNIEMKVFSMGIGPVIGLNLNFKKGLTLALKAGALSMGSAGEIDIKSGIFNLADPDFEIEGEGSYAFINVGLIFRLGDEYKKGRRSVGSDQANYLKRKAFALQ